jgi:hypothetical protein
MHNYIMNLCLYRNVFGAPGVGIHGIRFLNFAVVDVVFTLIAAYMISHFSKLSFLWSSITLFALGIFFHHIFCVDTTLAKLIKNLIAYL